MNTDPPWPRHVFDIFEHSPYFAEQLIRNAGVAGGTAAGRRADRQDLRSGLDAHGGRRRTAALLSAGDVPHPGREHLSSDSDFHHAGATSDLADAVIAAAYRMAVDQVAATRGPAAPDYEPADQMMVITMGRLGMREFDLGSDADLIFVLPDRDASELLFWTRVAERIIAIHHVVYGRGRRCSRSIRGCGRTDARAAGADRGRLQELLREPGEAWEGISYMKCAPWRAMWRRHAVSQ